MARQICGTPEPSSRGIRHSFHWLCGAPREESGFRKLKVLSQYRGRIADQPSSGKTVAGKRREGARESRTVGPSEEMVQYALKRGHLELACRAEEDTQGGVSDGTSVSLAPVVEPSR